MRINLSSLPDNSFCVFSMVSAYLPFWLLSDGEVILKGQGCIQELTRLTPTKGTGPRGCKKAWLSTLVRGVLSAWHLLADPPLLWVARHTILPPVGAFAEEHKKHGKGASIQLLAKGTREPRFTSVKDTELALLCTEIYRYKIYISTLLFFFANYFGNVIEG